jgi:hypothetical protein
MCLRMSQLQDGGRMTDEIARLAKVLCSARCRETVGWAHELLGGNGGYVGPKLANQLVGLPVELEIVKRTDKAGGFKVLRRRWVIERTFSWLRRNRRLMAHYEALVMIAVGFAKLAMIGVMLKRLTEVAS